MKLKNICIIIALLFIPSSSRVLAQDNQIATKPPKIVSAAKIGYPQLALTAHIDNTVIVELKIDHNGQVVATNIIEGHPLLNRAVENGVKKWRFNNDENIDSFREACITINFTPNVRSVYVDGSKNQKKYRSYLEEDSTIEKFSQPSVYEVKSKLLTIEILRLHH